MLNRYSTGTHTHKHQLAVEDKMQKAGSRYEKHRFTFERIYVSE